MRFFSRVQRQGFLSGNSRNQFPEFLWKNLNLFGIFDNMNGELGTVPMGEATR